MKNMKFSVASFALTLVVFYGLIVLLVWQQILHQTVEDRQETIAAAVRHHNNLVFALEQNTLRTIQEADVVLRLAKHQIEQSGNRFSLNQFVGNGINKLPVFDGLAVLDGGGNIAAIYPQSLKSLYSNLSSREHFTIHKTFRDTLFISKPFISSSLQKPVIVISRRINDKKGQFSGTVALQISPSAFMAFYKEASLNQYDILSLIAPDGITYSRRTGNIESSGEIISKSPLFTYLKKSATGAYFAKDAIRNMPTYFSYRKLKSYPVIATVGSREADILASFRQRKNREYAFGAIVSLLLFTFCSYLLFAFMQRKKSVKSLVSSETRYRSIFEGSRDAIFLLNPCGTIESMNRAAKALFRFESFSKNTSIYQRSFQELYVTTKPFSVFYSNLADNKELVFERLDGSTFTAEIASSEFADPDGRNQLLFIIRDVTARKQMEKRLAQEKKRHQLKLTKQIIVAQEQEREALGKELHDNVNQILTTAKLLLETALISEDRRNELIHRAVGHIVHSIKEIRSLSHRLSAFSGGTQSLSDAITNLAENMKACSSININVEIDCLSYAITKDQSLAIYRITQEQLCNVAKHAEASELTIELHQTSDSTVLILSDNGKGFDVDDARCGIGLQNIKSRAKAFGGDFTINSSPGEGCEILVRIPHEKNLCLLTK